jgi:2-isopropylmalate synthase
MLNAETPVCAVFGKAWDFHVQDILKITLEDNLLMVRDTVGYLKKHEKEVIFDAEHFFDGYRENSEYALKVLNAAALGGADCISLCDTNGGTPPDEVGEITKKVCELFPDIRIAIHCHDDIGCAVANSMAAVKSGASQVQGTFVGFGERCGNADLSTIIPNLVYKIRH